MTSEMMSVMTSEQWIRHFRGNALVRRIDWTKNATLAADDRLVRSLQAWQKGETSDGRHLLRAAAKFATRFDDPRSLDATRLFIAEEQKHGGNLGRYLDRIGAPRLGFDIGDWLFRRVRYFNASIEVWTITVIIVEMLAQMYYAALAKAADCPLLRDICDDILADESPHIRFQAERLHTVVADRGPATMQLARAAYRGLFAVVVRTVWLAHGHVFRAAGYSRPAYLRKIRTRFDRILADLPDCGLQNRPGDCVEQD